MTNDSVILLKIICLSVKPSTYYMIENTNKEEESKIIPINHQLFKASIHFQIFKIFLIKEVSSHGVILPIIEWDKIGSSKFYQYNAGSFVLGLIYRSTDSISLI